MTRLNTITWGAEKFRVATWHVDEHVAYVSTGGRTFQPTVPGVSSLVGRLRDQGFGGVVTSALRPQDVPAFVASGFSERERLVVLRRAVLPVPPIDAVAQARLRRRRPDDLATLLAIDHAAFEPAWRLDADGIRDAQSATPRSRLRLSTAPTPEAAAELVGYAICGRAGRTGYLQRLAVHPDHQGHGHGRALVTDALDWLGRRRADDVLVNTQRSNERAIELYRSLGFEHDRGELIVLERSL
jgi:ribosomal protein S18 acetylase RimI-like enzyme